MSVFFFAKAGAPHLVICHQLKFKNCDDTYSMYQCFKRTAVFKEPQYTTDLFYEQMLWHKNNLFIQLQLLRYTEL